MYRIVFFWSEENYSESCTQAVRNGSWRPVLLAGFCLLCLETASVFLPVAMCPLLFTAWKKGLAQVPGCLVSADTMFLCTRSDVDCVSRARVCGQRECARGTLTNMAEMCSTRVSRALLLEQRHFDSGKHSCLCFPALLVFIFFFIV